MKKRVSPAASQLALIHALRDLPALKAPHSLKAEVLQRVGLSDTYWRLESPIGVVYVAHSRCGISMVSRANSDSEFERAFRHRFDRCVLPESAAPPAAVKRLIQKLKSGERPKLRFDLRGLSEFERAVLMKALEIPCGEVRPYSWIAKEIGRPDAVRAVGTALGKNPVPLLIPCHRVVCSDGRIGQYSMGGGRCKRTLLEVEGAHPETIEQVAARGIRFLGNESTRNFCYTTSGGIRSLVAENKVPFHSEREAIEAGYHPCRQCRPAVAS